MEARSSAYWVRAFKNSDLGPGKDRLLLSMLQDLIPPCDTAK